MTATTTGTTTATKTATSWDAARPVAPVHVFRLRGTQAEMGAQHGRLVRAVGGYEAVLGYYPRMPGLILRGPGGGNLAARLLFASLDPLFEALLRRLEARRPAPLRERTRAFMEALGVAPGQTRYIFIMDLLQNVIGLAGRYGLGPFARRAAEELPPACSSIAAWGRASADGALRYARNFDFPGIGIWDRGPAVVLCAPDRGARYGFVTTRGADVPGVTAFNEAGLAIAPHTRFHRDVRFDGAGIVDLGHEIARRAETIDDAVKIARERPVASSFGIAVASARESRAVTIETCGAAVEVVGPEAPGDDFLATTNRYRHALLRAGEVTATPAFVANSDGRYDALVRAGRDAQARGGLTGDDLEALLGTHCSTEGCEGERAAGGVPAQAYTVQSAVIEPERGAVRVSAGPCPAGKGPYATIPWRWAGDPGVDVGSEAILPDGAAVERARALAAGSRFASGGAAAEGYAAFVEAARLSGSGASLDSIGTALERATAYDPAEPVYRLLAAGIRLKSLDGARAQAHVEAGLAHERAEFRRGQLLLIGSRAADLTGDRARAAAWRRELAATKHPLLAEHRASARDEEKRPLTRAKLRATIVSIVLVDAR